MPAAIEPAPIVADDGKELWRWRWSPVEAPLRVFHIAHGLGGHSLLYEEAALALAATGYVVYGSDHRGHGKTAGAVDRLGYFADTDGWERTVTDLQALLVDERKRHPGLPLILLGHSMGAAIATQALFGSDLVDACILMGAAGRPEAYVHAIRFGAWVLRALFGRRARSPLLHRLALAKANRRFQPVATDFDWLSRDSEAVRRFKADPFCGFVGTTQLWLDLVHGVLTAGNPDNLGRMARGLPVLFITGGEDPINHGGQRVRMTIGDFHRLGHTRIEQKVYPGARHDLLLETIRQDVVADLHAWISRTLDGSVA